MEHISLNVISFTITGNQLANDLSQRLKTGLPDWDVTTYSVKRECWNSIYVESAKEWTKAQFETHAAILFIGACGIATRMIAPCIKDKLSDRPVLVMDELGQFVIPLLSGHVGGANEIALKLAQLMGAVPVITTATDIQETVAIDVFAKKHDLAIGNKDGIAKVSAKVLEKKKLTMQIAPEYAKQVDVRIQRTANDNSQASRRTDSKGKIHQPLLTLIPKEYILGIGCRKGKEPEVLASFVKRQLLHQNISWNQVKGIATIDVKKNEEAITRLASSQNLPLYIFDAMTLSQVNGDFTVSQFVKQQVGVDNVCERAAMAACKEDGSWVLRKTAEDGMTLAIVKQEWRLTLYEE